MALQVVFVMEKWREIASRESRLSLGFNGAYQLVSGSNPVDLFGWDDTDEDLLFARDTAASGQVAQQWELAILAQEAELTEAANSKLRRWLARKKSFDCTEVKFGDSALLHKAANRKSAPAKILDTGETKVAV